ncbi:MAG TPA: hypothetical protein V6D15_04555 [Oculatellaceae cyanobacterium]|jgi:hypothetical protein
MDSNIIKFRLSPDLLQRLNSARNENESLHQVAKRILENGLKNGTQSEHTEAKVVHIQPANGTQIQDTLEDIKAELKTEVIGEVKELLATYQDKISKKLTV